MLLQPLQGGFYSCLKYSPGHQNESASERQVMELTGETLIAAPRAAVWAALNDETVLARCIDGVESLTRVTGDDGVPRFDGKMNARVGPVRATFAGSVALTELDPPHRYLLVGEGKGGVAGFAKGQAEVVLDEDGGATRLRYAVSSSVGGKLAQLGSRLIEGAAKGYAATFFERFKEIVEAPVAVAAPVFVEPATPVEAAPAGGIPPLLWGGALIVAVLALLAWQLS